MVEHANFLIQMDQEDDNVGIEDDEEFNLKLEVISDKDILTGHLDTYKETMDNKISGCEKLITNSVKSEWS